MDGIRDFFGGIITKLKLGWLVEALMVHSLAVGIGCAVILLLIGAMLVIMVKKARKKNMHREDYKYCGWMLVYLFIALFVFSTTLDGIGNSIGTLFYILLLIVMPLILLTKYKDEQQKRIMQEKELSECRNMLELQKGYIAKSKEQYDDIRSMRHDLGDHIKTMEMLVANSKNEECTEYLEQIKEKLGRTDMRNDTGNPYIDAILTEAERRADDNGIRLMISCEGKLDKLKDSLSVGVVLGNALNNAFEACDRMKGNAAKIVDVNLVCRKDVILVVKNSCDDVIMADGRLSTLKDDKENHGIGMKNIESAVKALGGIMQWKHNSKEKQFTLMANWCQ